VRYIVISRYRLTVMLLCFLIVCSLFLSLIMHTGKAVPVSEAYSDGYIKWVDFNVPYAALKKAVDIDIKSHENEDGIKISAVNLLAYLSCKYGNNYSNYKAKDLESLAARLKEGASIESLTENMRYFPYYKESYTAIMDKFLGDYTVTKNGVTERKYGLTVFSPIAQGYANSSYDDFGNGRSYGFKRKHLGHDIMASSGTPIIAIESGTVTECGWNRYGGWRIGIKSFDGKRYYYYAHMQKDKPYHDNIKSGAGVKAGDVIGYVGRTGYSTTENTNNINKNHLHLGLQLIFHPSQETGEKEIWVDMYAITKLLRTHTMPVKKNPETKDFDSSLDFNIS